MGSEENQNGAPALPPIPQEQREWEARERARIESEVKEAGQQPTPTTDQPAPAPTPADPAPEAGAATVQAPGAPEQGTVGLPTQPVAAPEVDRPQSVPDNWPQQGYDGPQPWEVEDPPQLTHDRGLVTSGAAGPLVTELAACLAHLGIGTAISEGKNPHMIYGPAEEAGIAEFRRVFGVEEDPEIVRAAGEGVVGPWTWEALFRAVKQKAGD